ncbi:MAG: GSCFA domain-containing protein [Chitinophagales bacterium]|nr:GSCFA domain-containing protein [Chitinophagales bacterium]
MHTLQLNIQPLPRPISYESKLFLSGSCFAENMAIRLKQHRLNVLDNPHGIIFNPLSVANSIDGYIQGKLYSEDALFYLNELWNSWDHHTSFSHINKEEALCSINTSQKAATEFIRTATHVLITLGSAYYYVLKETGQAVSNNHRAPSQWFEKRLLTIEEITSKFTNTIESLLKVNPDVQLIFTVSPVRHYRDGLVENNRSKARIIESVHLLCDKFEQAYYFPAYELVMDVLRDHRYYDIDFVHPNYLATDYVWGRLTEACMDTFTLDLMKQVHEVALARKHRTRFPQTEAHKKFRESYVQKIRALMAQYPYLQLNEELAYFSE